MKIIDISLEIKNNMIVYPNNPKPQIEQVSSIPKSKTNGSKITIGSHSGTHIDSPLHIKNNGHSTNGYALDKFYGQCRVIDLTLKGREINREHLEKYKIKKNEIILLKTENSKKGYAKFRDDFAYIEDEAARYLAEQKIKVIGFDYLSVVKRGSKSKTHNILLNNNIVIFEGLDLRKVKPGKYIFVGLPLKIKCDGAPARVILIQN